MNKLTRYGMMAAALLFSAAALAATITLRWDNATEYVNGDSPVDTSGPDAIRDTVIEYGPCNPDKTGIASVSETITVPPTTLSLMRDQLPSGSWCARARHTTNAGIEGQWTEVLSIDKAPRVPKAPSNFSGS
jgi:hypothetical protein